jgi:hypothetical protein
MLGLYYTSKYIIYFELRIEMDVKNYLERAEVIRKDRLLTFAEMCEEIGITYQTLQGLRKTPDWARMKTLKKLKVFVERWELKNMSQMH